MRTTRVEYPSGREMLAAYWGFLGSGGLVLREPAGLDDGDPVLLDVKIFSLKKEYRLAGRIRKQDGRAWIVFDAGQAQDAMLYAAFADSQGTPERRHRRLDVSLPIRYRIGNAVAPGRMLNLSRGGCCLEVDATLRSGTRLLVEVDGFAVGARVRWCRARSRHMGVEFDTFQDDLVTKLAH
jgi:hypothetical protein